MEFVLVGLILLTGIAYHIFAIQRGNRTVKYVLKPGTMLLIIALALAGVESDFGFWVILALVGSLAGDVFLMLKERYFIYGLSSFFVAHLLYIVALTKKITVEMTSYTGVISGVTLFIIGSIFYYSLIYSVKKQGGRLLSIAVLFYIIVISVMVWLALLTGSNIIFLAAWLFFISDAVLAWDKFKKSFSIAEHLVMSTYFTAQFMFAISV